MKEVQVTPERAGHLLELLRGMAQRGKIRVQNGGVFGQEPSSVGDMVCRLVPYDESTLIECVFNRGRVVSFRITEEGYVPERPGSAVAYYAVSEGKIVIRLLIMFDCLREGSRTFTLD